MLVTVHAGASQGYVLGIPLYPTGRSSTQTGPFGLGLGLGLAHSCMYCDQPSLLTRDPGGGVNEEIPHRWAKQPARNVVEVSECFWTVPGQSGAELPIFICP